MPISLASSSSKSFNDYVYDRLPYRQLKSKMITKPMCGTRIQSYQFVYFVARIHDKKKRISNNWNYNVLKTYLIIIVVHFVLLFSFMRHEWTRHNRRNESQLSNDDYIYMQSQTHTHTHRGKNVDGWWPNRVEKNMSSKSRMQQIIQGNGEFKTTVRLAFYSMRFRVKVIVLNDTCILGVCSFTSSSSFSCSHFWLKKSKGLHAHAQCTYSATMWC